MTHVEVTRHRLLIVKVFYAALALILLSVLITGMALVSFADYFSLLMVGVGEVFVGFLGALYVLIKYRSVGGG